MSGEAGTGSARGRGDLVGWTWEAYWTGVGLVGLGLLMLGVVLVTWRRE